MATTDHLAGLELPHGEVLAQLLRVRLLDRREALATAAIEHTAHDLPGADLLWQALDAVEEQMRILLPDTWSAHYPEWVDADAARLHTAGSPRPQDCSICAQSSTPALHQRAS